MAGAIHGPSGPSSRQRRPTARTRISTGIGAFVVALALSSPAGASLHAALARALAAPGVSASQTGAFVYDLNRSRIVLARQQTLALLPASNEKLGVAVAALNLLGPNFRIPTEVLGQGSLTPDGVWHGRLILKGHGDPSLGSARLAVLAGRVRAAGISSVTGPIAGDESYFDTMRVARGWKPSYYKEECPPLSALIVNRGRVGARISDNPARAAARLFKLALQRAGVAVGGRSVNGVASPTATLVAHVFSPGVSRLVRRMDLTSDNFYGEMLLKVLGANIRGLGTTAAGARVVRRELVNRGVTMTGVRFVDGSGLSALDRLTARAVGQLLISAASDAKIKTYFVASLPIAGVSGTLSDRMRSGPAHRHVFAKTGTTDRASALSGYAGTRYVFSILMNGRPVPWISARRAQDRFAQLLAGAP